jgi:hypothetical protein
LAPEGIFGFPGCVEVQLVRARRRQIVMMEKTKGKEEKAEAVSGNRDAMPGWRYDWKSFRTEHQIFVIGQWSFVIGHFNER